MASVVELDGFALRRELWQEMFFLCRGMVTGAVVTQRTNWAKRAYRDRAVCCWLLCCFYTLNFCPAVKPSC